MKLELLFRSAIFPSNFFMVESQGSSFVTELVNTLLLFNVFRGVHFLPGSEG